MNLTYTVAIVGLLWGIVGVVFGFIDGTAASTIILTSLGVFGIRKSISNQAVGGKSAW